MLQTHHLSFSSLSRISSLDQVHGAIGQLSPSVEFKPQTAFLVNHCSGKEIPLRVCQLVHSINLTCSNKEAKACERQVNDSWTQAIAFTLKKSERNTRYYLLSMFFFVNKLKYIQIFFQISEWRVKEHCQTPRTSSACSCEIIIKLQQAMIRRIDISLIQPHLIDLTPVMCVTEGQGPLDLSVFLLLLAHGRATVVTK